MQSIKSSCEKECNKAENTINGDRTIVIIPNVASEKPEILKCESCNTPIEKDIELLGTIRRVGVLCHCRAEELRIYDEKQEFKKRQTHVNRFRVYSLMDERFENSTFERWMHVPDKEFYYELGIRYCDNWGAMSAGNHGFMFHGATGTGKTYLSFAIANRLNQQGISALAISVPKILNLIKDSYDNHGHLGETQIMDAIYDVSLLILDDLGVEYKTGWAYEKLYTIIDTRYRSGKPLIVTTNKSIEDLRKTLTVVDTRTREDDPSERIFNRILEMCAFEEIGGGNWRQQMSLINRNAMYEKLGLPMSK